MPQAVPPRTPISKDNLLRTDYAMLVLTTLFVLVRVAIHVARKKTLELHDYFIYFAYCLYVSLWTCYIIAIPVLYKLDAVATGRAQPYPEMVDDAGYMARLIFSSQMCFYTCLYSVKASLLVLYLKLLSGLHNIYKKIWIAIVVFCFLTWIGCIISSAKSCDDMDAFFHAQSSCSKPNETRAQIASLYYSYAVDVVTDLMVMFLPIRLTWNLQMPRGQKIGVFILFGTGFICIAFATLRVVQIGVEGGKVVSPDPRWMSLWTVVETSMAILIGCSPAFAALIRTRINTQKSSSYNARGYIKQQSSQDIKLKNKISSPVQNHTTTATLGNDTFWDDRSSSQEQLAKNEGGILVTTSIRQSDGRSSGQSGHV